MRPPCAGLQCRTSSPRLPKGPTIGPRIPRVRRRELGFWNRGLGVEDVVEVPIGLAVAQGADVEFCHDTELERFGSIAAIERD